METLGHEWALEYDFGNHRDTFAQYPPQGEIDEARRAAPDSPTRVLQLVGGWDSQLIHEWPPLDDDPSNPEEGER